MSSPDDVAALEAELVAAKEAGDAGSDEYRDLKLRLRDARRAERGGRSGFADDGDAVAAAETIEVTTNGDL